jgi:hypothetical protein
MGIGLELIWTGADLAGRRCRQSLEAMLVNTLRMYLGTVCLLRVVYAMVLHAALIAER